MSKKLFVLIAALAIVLSACGTAPTPQVIYVEQQQVVVQQQAPACETCGQQPAEAPPAPAVAQPEPPQVQPEIPSYFGSDGIGPEEHFPDSIDGPAIAELWDANVNYCAIVKVLDGETLSWKLAGSYWLFANSDYQDLRWPSHKKEYMAKDANCHVYNSVAAFLVANPSYAK